MVEPTNPNSIEIVSIGERESLLRMNPGFTELTINELSTLVGLMKEVHFDAHQTIVKEGDFIDSIYIIASGSAEVTKRVPIDGKEGNTLVAILNQGESIGLKEANLFSETGTRTATVIANTACLLLQLDLKDLNQFFSNHPHLLASLKKSTALTLRMQLIKEADPFKKLSNQRIIWLATSVKEISVAAGDFIFRQDDIADSCYMISEGQVDILVRESDGTERIISTLHEGQLFGEGALLKAAKRNAGARAKTPCQLFLLDQEILLELSEEPSLIHDELMSRVIDRTQPIRHENIIYQRRTMADGEIITTLKDPVKNNYIQLNEEGWFIWQQLNGKLSLQEITQLFSEQFGRFDPDLVLDIIHTLVDDGFAYLDLLQADKINQGQVSKKFGILNFFEFKYFIKNSDKKMNFLYRYGGFIFFNIISLLILTGVVITGIILFPSVFSKTILLFSTYQKPFFLFLSVIIVGMTLRLISPLSKALTIKRLGHTVPHFALGWQWIFPTAYVDSSDLWLSSRLNRFLVILSGIASELLVAGLLSCYAHFTSNASLAFFASLCALFIYLQTLRSLNPILDLEGYQLMINALDSPKLRETTFKWVFPSLTGSNRVKLKTKRPTFIYLLSCLSYLFILLALATWIEKKFLPYWFDFSWSLGLIYSLLVIGFILEIAMEMYYQKKMTRLLRME